ncbi:MAG: ABC transporter ATP-binding protein, partial [Acidimicrobiales bacterium]|nr:ABC transporter ATP-binding protein [Acidimicrobiales bacterium]
MHGMHPHMVIGRDKDGVKGKSLDRSTVRRVLAYADRYRAMLLGFVATLLVSSLLSIVPALLVRRIIDDAIPASDRGQVNSLALIMVGLALASGVISLIERFFSARIGENLIFDLRVQLFDHVQRMPIGFFTRTQTGALISRMNNDVIGAQRALTGTLGQVISNVIVLATTLVAMFILEWRLPLLALGLLPFFLLPTKRVGRVLQGLTREQMDHNAAMNTTMTERLNVAGAMVVKLFGRHDDERDGFGARAGAVRDLGIRSAMYGRAFTIGLTVVGALGTAVIYWVGGRLAIGGSISVGTVVAMGLYVTRIYLPLTGLTNARVDIMTAMVSFERVFEVLDTHNPITDAADAVELREPAGRIVADNLAFAYPSDSNAPASLEAGGVSPASSGVENPLVLA